MSGAIEARRAPTGATVRAWMAAVPSWAWLVGLVAVSTVVRFALALPNPGPWIFQDENVYWELATSLGKTGGFAIRDVPGRHGFGFVYPALLSPATAIFGNPETAYTAAKAINAFLMSLAAVPTYFLARRLVGQGLSLLAAVLAVAIPGMVYTASIMTENAFYPLIAAFALALVLMLERPTAMRQLAVWAVVAVAFFTRPQAAILVPVVLTAVALVVLVEPRERRFAPGPLLRRLGAYAVTWVLLGLTGVAVVVLQLVRGTEPNELLGSASGVTGFSAPPGAIARWFLYHLADLDLALGFIPFAAFLVVALLAFRSHRLSRRLMLFAAVSVPLVFWFTLTSSVYAAQPIGQRITERYLFHVAPVFFVALVVWVARGLPRPLWAAGPSIAIMAALPAAIPYDAFLNANAAHSTFSLAPVWSFRDELSMAPGDIDIAVLLGAVAAGVLVALLGARWALLLPGLVLAYFALATSPLEGITTKASRDALRAGIDLRANGPDAPVERTWIDERVGTESDVVWVWASDLQLPLWETEFFNDSVGRVYNLYGSLDGLPQETVAVDRAGRLLDTNGNPVEALYALVPRGLTLVGEVVGNDPTIGTKLYRVDGPLVLVEQVDGLYTDRWSGAEVTYTRHACSGGTLTLELSSFADLHPAPQTVVASVDGAEVARTTLPVGAAGEVFVVPLRPDDAGRCSVAFSISPTAVPAAVLASADQRELGVLFDSLRYEPDGG